MQTAKDNSRAFIQTCVHTSITEYGGMCASVAMFTLCKLFDTVMDDIVLDSGTGIRFGGLFGAAQSAFAGTAQFIASITRLHGLDKHQLSLLYDTWQQRYEQYVATLPPDDIHCPANLATDVILLAQETILENRKILGLDASLIKPRQYYDNIYSDRESMFKHSPYALEAKLSAAVTKGDGETALAALRAITAQGEKAVLAKDPVRSAKNSMIGSIAFLARATIQAGVNANDAFSLSDALIQQIEEMRDRKKILAFEEHILLQFIMLVRRRLELSYSTPVVKVMHYVENHLDSKILLSDAAAYAGVHPAYISARFKKEVSLPFTEYVTVRKIQESCYFIRHTDYSVSQVASLYGFSSQSYYIALFKKIMGITPVEYRRRVWAE
ncbi:helix-turn-helix transcriptional regulator [Lachnospiraceae bacterium OttesenSCG-928-D06]|nr:helix-turn-helix transcriptional regulator [Lachnospiraceae bacterium OttesenSCG-928-D06]